VTHRHKQRSLLLIPSVFFADQTRPSPRKGATPIGAEWGLIQAGVGLLSLSAPFDLSPWGALRFNPEVVDISKPSETHPLLPTQGDAIVTPTARTQSAKPPAA
jgi:hypothetical protein